MATYRSPFYPSLQVMLDGERSVRFVGGYAEVEDADVETFEAWVQSTDGQMARVHRADGLVNQNPDAPRDPADDLGPGYTPAEREAYRMQRSQTAPPPPEDQRTEGQKAAASMPLFPGVTPATAPEVDPPQAALDSADAAHALREEQEAAAAREAAAGGHEPGQDLGTADTEGAPEVDAETGQTDDGLDELKIPELKDRLKAAGQKTSGNRDELIARLRETA